MQGEELKVVTRSIVLQEIYALQQELYCLMELHRKFSHPAVVQKSQELDQLVIQWHTYVDCVDDDDIVDDEARVV